MVSTKKIVKASAALAKLFLEASLDRPTELLSNKPANK
ncbi:hypothetical protein RAMDARK_1799 [Rickettsia amblyommatis str. Darkwater]|nr:hypothetical protein RAMDARK_1799 [Rickettsia amblyommatis str. Darkwater]